MMPERPTSILQERKTMSDSNAEKNKAIVVDAFDTLFKSGRGYGATVQERESDVRRLVPEVNTSGPSTIAALAC
jgi:hypothetical protein